MTRLAISLRSFQKQNNQAGQGLVEYLVIVALMGVATIGIVRVMGQTVTSRFATITEALHGGRHVYKADPIEASTLKRKDLGNFFDGVGSKTQSDDQ